MFNYFIVKKKCNEIFFAKRISRDVKYRNYYREVTEGLDITNCLKHAHSAEYDLINQEFRRLRKSDRRQAGFDSEAHPVLVDNERVLLSRGNPGRKHELKLKFRMLNM